MPKISKTAAFLTACLFYSTAAISPSVAEQAQYVMKMGTATINDTQHEWLRRFASKVKDDSHGRIKVEIYPASQLGSIPRMIEQTQFNSAQGYVGPAEFLSGVDIRFEVLGAPGVFSDVGNANRVIQDPEFSGTFLSMGEKKGLKGLGLFISGPASFVTPKPIRSLQDFAGLKIRVTSSPFQIEQVRMMGAAPVPIALSEVLPALQQGALNGVMGNAPVFAVLHYSSVAKYQLQTDQMMYVSIAVTSRSFFDKLPADLQKIVADDGLSVSREIYPFSVEQINRSLEDWTKEGGELYRLSPNDEAELRKRLATIGDVISSKREDEHVMYQLLKTTADRMR